MSGLGSLSDAPDRLEMRRSVILGNPDEQSGHDQSHERGQPEEEWIDGVALDGKSLQHAHGDRVERSTSHDTRDNKPFVEGVHDVLALADLYEERTEHGCQDGNAAEN